MSKRNKGTAADVAPTTQPEAIEGAESPIVDPPGVEDRTNGAFGEALVDPTAAPPAKATPTAADLVAKMLGGEGTTPEAAPAASPADLGVVQLVHGKLGEIGDPVRNPPGLTVAELDALAPRLRLPGGATIRRENLSSASRHTKGLVVVVSNRAFAAPGVKV